MFGRIKKCLSNNEAFLWKLVHDRLLTNEERVRRGMATDNLCPRCLDCPETIMHVLRDCDDVREFWLNKLNPDVISKFFSLGLHPWLVWNLTDSNIGVSTINWQTVFGVTGYELWKDRNSLVFSRQTLLGSDLHFKIGHQVSFISNHISDPVLSFSQDNRKEVQVAWHPPHPGRFKINVDGSHLRNSGSSACGGLVRDSNGRFVQGFFCKIGLGNALWAELWGIRLGIKLAKHLNLNHVDFELDSKVVTHLIKTGNTVNVHLQPLLQNIIQLLQHPDWSTTVVGYPCLSRSQSVCGPPSQHGPFFDIF